MQRILVGMKSVPDANVRIRISPDSGSVLLDGVKMTINPFCEIALEEALRIKERGIAEEVVIACIGPKDCQQQLRAGLAMGADRAVHVVSDKPVNPLVVAHAFLALIAKEVPFLVLLGKQAIDHDNGQTGQMLAALWDRPQATYASNIEITGGVALVTREVDAGLETLEVDLPAVITADLRLNTPRYVKLPDIMKAKKKPIDIIALTSLSLPAVLDLHIVKVEAPPVRASGVTLRSVQDLLTALRTKGVLE